MMSTKKVKEEIIRFGKTLGFELVKVGPALLPDKYEKLFKEWIKDRKNGEMKYLENRDHLNNQVLPGAKTVISLGLNYFQGELRDELPNPLKPYDSSKINNEGRVARYAITRDYHKIIEKKLKLFSKYIEEEFNAQTKCYVDTGPILERAYSENSGIGYTGRNSCIITKEFGSWVFLAEILTTLELPIDDSEVRLSCGTCDRCINLCPTGAIQKNKTIDASKCISYLTIENKEGIPIEFRDKIGGWIYGCDICQDVCPHNAKACATKLEDFKDVRIKNRRLSLKKILSIKNDDEFLEIFAGTPLMRAKRRGLLRNACVVAGNSGKKALIPLLERITQNEDGMLTEHAKWAIKIIQKTSIP